MLAMLMTQRWLEWIHWSYQRICICYTVTINNDPGLRVLVVVGLVQREGLSTTVEESSRMRRNVR